MGDCSNICRGKDTKGVDTLFAEFDVGPVLASSKLKNVKNWCYKYVIGDLWFPKCIVEAEDADGKTTQLTKFSFTNPNSMNVDVSSLEDDQTYVFRLVETSSKMQSLPYNLHIFDPVGIPLKPSTVSQYSCYPHDSKDLRLNFFFGKTKPVALTGTESIVCHDVEKYGLADSDKFPRLDLISPVTSLWNPSNILFYDNDADGVLDVNELVASKILEAGGEVKSSLRLFGALSAPGTKVLNLEAGNNNYDRLGFVMSYWVDNTKNFASFCPSEADFATGTPVMKTMKEVLGKGTEGIYIADRSESEVRTYLFIRESDLRAVWFYNNNGTPAKPSEDQLQFQTIYFYHPLNKENPYVKGPNQKVYRVRAGSELPSNLTTLQAFTPNTVEMISYPSHDRKLGCIPKN
jgi:hypothetical protein